MPIDLAANDPTLRITNRHGEILPFSRGIMATSLMATGLHTEEAYRLASIVQESLHDGRARHDSDELVAVACDVLRSQPDGEQIVRRWLAWRAVRRSGRPVVIAPPSVHRSNLASRRNDEPHRDGLDAQQPSHRMARAVGFEAYRVVDIGAADGPVPVGGTR